MKFLSQSGRYSVHHAVRDHFTQFASPAVLAHPSLKIPLPFESPQWTSRWRRRSRRCLVKKSRNTRRACLIRSNFNWHHGCLISSSSSYRLPYLVFTFSGMKIYESSLQGYEWSPNARFSLASFTGTAGGSLASHVYAGHQDQMWIYFVIFQYFYISTDVLHDY